MFASSAALGPRLKALIVLGATTLLACSTPEPWPLLPQGSRATASPAPVVSREAAPSSEAPSPERASPAAQPASKTQERTRARPARKGPKAAQAHYLQGAALCRGGRHREAIQRYENAIEFDPEHSGAIHGRGNCRLKVWELLPGVLDLSRALELDPRLSARIYQRIQQTRFRFYLVRTIQELDRRVKERPRASHVVFLRGLYRMVLVDGWEGQREDLLLGIADFKRCLELNPKHVTAFLYSGFLWAHLGAQDSRTRERCYAQARASYKRALELDPRSELAHYFQALLASRCSGEAKGSAEARRLRLISLAELKLAFKFGYKGRERIRYEAGFDPIRQLPAFKRLLADR